MSQLICYHTWHNFFHLGEPTLGNRGTLQLGSCTLCFWLWDASGIGPRDERCCLHSWLIWNIYIMLVLVEVWNVIFSDVEKSYGQRTMYVYIYWKVLYHIVCFCFHYDFCTTESILSILFILLLTVKAKLWRDVIPKPCSIFLTGTWASWVVRHTKNYMSSTFRMRVCWPSNLMGSHINFRASVVVGATGPFTSWWQQLGLRNHAWSSIAMFVFWGVWYIYIQIWKLYDWRLLNSNF